MASSVNLVILLGNLTRDIELRFTPNGQAVANCTVATNRHWTDKDSGEKKESAEFTDVVFWGKTAEIAAQYLAKGNQVHLQGRLQTRSWEDENGNKRRKTEVVVTDLTFLRRGEPSPTSEVGQDEVILPPDEGKGSDDLMEGFEEGGEEKPKGKATEEVNPDDIPF